MMHEYLWPVLYMCRNVGITIMSVCLWACGWFGNFHVNCPDVNSWTFCVHCCQTYLQWILMYSVIDMYCPVWINLYKKYWYMHQLDERSECIGWGQARTNSYLRLDNVWLLFCKQSLNWHKKKKNSARKPAEYIHISEGAHHTFPWRILTWSISNRSHFDVTW